MPRPELTRSLLDFAQWESDLRDCLILLTRLRVARAPGRSREMAEAMRAFPLVGAIVGLIGGVAFMIGDRLGLQPLLAAAVAVAVMLPTTGGFHEDGLADTADGFGGGDTRERKLEIMRDSRLGTYGAMAVLLALLVRILAAAQIASFGSAAAVLVAFVAAGAWSRSLVVVLLHSLSPARADGQSMSAGAPSSDTMWQAVGVGAALMVVLVPWSFGFWAAIAAFVLSLIAFTLARWLAVHQIGGHTGDVAGAVQQAAECAVLIALAAVLNPG